MIRINEVNYKVQTGYQVRESLTNELDSCFVVLHLKEKPDIKLYDIAEFYDKKRFVSIINFVRKKEGYQANVTLSELTLILEKYILSPCSFTNMNDTLNDQIEKLFYKVEPLRVGETPRFKLEQELSNILASKPGEDFIYPERMTLREILDDMLSSLGYRAEVLDLTSDLSQIKIGYRDLNKKSSDIKSLTKITAEDEFWSAEYYANELDVSLTNVQSRKRAEVIHDWQTLKPVEIENANDKNIKLVVDHPIEELTKVSVNYVLDVKYREAGVNDIKDEKGLNFIFDITNLFLEKEIYDTLDVVQQQNYIPYVRGSNIIGVMDAYKLLFFNYSKLRNYLAPLTDIRAKEMIETKNGIVVDSIQFTLPNVADGMLFKVHYIPYLDINYKHSKDNDFLGKKITSVYNQTDRNLDLSKFTSLVRSLANRLGNREMTVGFIANETEQLLSLGDVIKDNYSLVSREYQVFNGFIKGQYTFFQNYDGNATARLSREKRLYNIPQEGLVDRKVVVKDNLLISTEPITAPVNSSLLPETLEIIVKSLEGNPGSDYIDRILFQTRDKNNKYYPSNNSYFSLNFSSSVVGKSLIWQMRMQNNYSVGLSSSKRQWLGREVYLNPYVDNNGEFERLDFRLIKNDIEALSFSDRLVVGKTLPEIDLASYPDYIGKRYSSLTSGYNCIVKKDRLEVLNFIYQLEAVPNEDIVVGTHFMEFINLLRNREYSTLKLYVSHDQIYNVNDVDRVKGFTLDSNYTFIVSGTTVSTNYQAELIQSWAIGTEDGRLLLAVNSKKRPLNKIYFGLSRNK